MMNFSDEFFTMPDLALAFSNRRLPMNPSYRVLKKDLIYHLDQSSSWPAVKRTESWLRNQAEISVSSGQYTDMRNHRPTLERFVMGWIRMLLEDTGIHNEPVRRSLCKYLGWDCGKLAGTSAEELAIELLEEPIDWRFYSGRHKDFLMRGVYRLGSTFSSRAAIRKIAHDCSDQSHIGEVIRWMYVYCGRESEGVGSLDEEKAVAAAESHIGLPLGAYQDRALQWQRFNPWTLVVAKEEDKSIAMCIVLPLTGEAYDAVKAGSLKSYDVAADRHLQAPSANLLIEGIAVRPPEYGPIKINPTKAILRLGLAQCGVFTFRPKHRPGNIRLLTFAGTPRNEKRLFGQGFRPIGKRMPGTGAKLYELVIPRMPIRMHQMVMRGALRMTGHAIISPPEP
jgi:hypothetical protein